MRQDGNAGDDPKMTAHVGPIDIDVPRTAGYYGGIAVATAVGIIEWPLALFLGSIPLIKLLQRRDLPAKVRFAVHLFDGAAKPVGGDTAGTMVLSHTPPQLRRRAQDLVDGGARRRRRPPRAGTKPDRA